MVRPGKTSVTIELTNDELNMVKQYAGKFEEDRDNDWTADPIVAVRDVVEVYVDDESYEYQVYYDMLKDRQICKKQAGYQDRLRSYGEFDEKELLEILEFADDTSYMEADRIAESEEQDNVIVLRNVVRHRVPVAFFLTLQEAKRYCEYQAHNLTDPSIYTYNAGYGNKGDMPIGLKILKRIGDVALNKE